MKLIKKMALGLLISSNIYAYPTPKHLKDSKITLQTKDGKKGIYNGNDWKVVRRTVKIPAHSVLHKKKVAKNAFFLTINSYDKAYGYCLDNSFQFASRKALAFGVRYQRSFSNVILSGEINTNLDSNLGLGFSW